MKRLVLFLLGMFFIGCSHSINSEYNENNLNSISYTANDKYVRSAVNDLSPSTLHIDIYKVPVLSTGRFDYGNKKFVRTETLDYGEEKEIERCSETGYIYAINCQEYQFLCAWYGYKNELNFFEYENNIVLQKVMYFYHGPNYGIEYSNGSQFAYSNGDGKYFTYSFFGSARIANCKKYIEECYGEYSHSENDISDIIDTKLHPYLYGEVCNSYFSNTVPFLLASSIFPKNVDNEDLVRQQRNFQAAGEDFLRKKIYNYNYNGNSWDYGSFEQYYLNQWTFTGWAKLNPVASEYLIVTYSVSVEYQ